MNNRASFKLRYDASLRIYFTGLLVSALASDYYWTELSVLLLDVALEFIRESAVTGFPTSCGLAVPAVATSPFMTWSVVVPWSSTWTQRGSTFAWTWATKIPPYFRTLIAKETSWLLCLAIYPKVVSLTSPNGASAAHLLPSGVAQSIFHITSVVIVASHPAPSVVHRLTRSIIIKTSPSSSLRRRSGLTPFTIRPILGWCTSFHLSLRFPTR